MNVQFPDSFSEARLLIKRLRASCSPSQRARTSEQLYPRENELQMVVEGGVLRQRYLPDGRRQTVAVYYRDDVINLGRFARRQHLSSDYLLALRGTIVGTVADEEVNRLRADSPTGTDGMTALVFRELGIAEERLVSMSQRSATEAMAHFMCETLQRCSASGGNYKSDRCQLCMTQEILATVLGLSTVHVNRVLRQLRKMKLADIVHSELVVYDYGALSALAGFEDGYLAPV